MNEDKMPQAQNDITPEDSEVGDQAPVKVFDISEDSISPVSDIEPKQTFVKESPPVIKPVTNPIPPISLAKQPVTNPNPIPIPVKPPVASPSPIGNSSLASNIIPPVIKDENVMKTFGISPTETKSQDKAGTENGVDTKKAINSTLKPLRTYESDVAEILARSRTSRATIAIAENKRTDGEESLGNRENSSSSIKKMILALLSLMIFGGGVFGAYYLYSISPLAPVPYTAPSSQKPTSLVSPDEQVVLDISGMDPMDIHERLRFEFSNSQSPNTIKEIIPTEISNEKTIRIGGPKMISLIDIEAPDILLRSLTEPWMLGVYADPNGEKSSFVIVTTNFFQNTFAGMLQWENLMADDIKQYLFPVRDLPGVANIPTNISPTGPISNILDDFGSILPTASTTDGSNESTSSTTHTVIGISPDQESESDENASSTETFIEPFFTIRGQFEDAIIKNKDVRIFRTQEGNILFLYSFIDENRLIISGSEKALIEVLNRLEKQTFIR